jgi:hypothetical protein
LTLVKGEPIPSDERIIRRFNPDDANACTHDEAGLPARLTAFAFKFTASESDPESEILECSVYQESKLGAEGMTAFDCAHEEFSSVAIAAVSEVSTFKRDRLDDANPFAVAEDAFPDGQPPTHARDAAHALIVHSMPLPGSKKWYRDLALKFKPLIQAS